MAALAKANIARVVVDEVHVLESCNVDFRPAYLKIGAWIRKLPNRPQIIALSATLSEKARVMVEASLGMKKTKVIRYPMKRSNLKFFWNELDSSEHALLRLQMIESDLLEWKETKKKKRGSVIIYCNTPSQVERIYNWLQARNWSVSTYHGKLDGTQKEDNMKKFMSGDVPIMIANSAFGMGVDQQSVRLVVHCYPPLGLCEYAQQSGRAGRDGNRARCVLYFTEKDWAKCNNILKGRGLDELEALQDLLSLEKFSWKYIEDHFTKPYTPP